MPAGKTTPLDYCIRLLSKRGVTTHWVGVPLTFGFFVGDIHGCATNACRTVCVYDEKLGRVMDVWMCIHLYAPSELAFVIFITYGLLGVVFVSRSFGGSAGEVCIQAFVQTQAIVMASVFFATTGICFQHGKTDSPAVGASPRAMVSVLAALRRLLQDSEPELAVLRRMWPPAPRGAGNRQQV